MNAGAFIAMTWPSTTEGHRRRAINPITHTNGEHVGVKPDVATTAADAMKTAYVTILKERIATTDDAEERALLDDTLDSVDRGEVELPGFAPPRR